jgi:crotonobetainyl-CoA:carnitine CoA-transferase CaiB-like acyl-CoA transferase
MAEETDALAGWAASGAMWLTGHPDGAPLCPAAAVVPALNRVAADLAQLSTQVGRRVDVDIPTLLTGRAALRHWHRQGQTSANGTCRLLLASDGWIALNLSRPSDLDLLPALLERSVDDDYWPAVAHAASRLAAAQLVERATLLGLPLAALPASSPPGTNASARGSAGAEGQNGTATGGRRHAAGGPAGDGSRGTALAYGERIAGPGSTKGRAPTAGRDGSVPVFGPDSAAPGTTAARGRALANTEGGGEGSPAGRPDVGAAWLAREGDGEGVTSAGYAAVNGASGGVGDVPITVERVGQGQEERPAGWRPVVVDLSAMWAGPLCGHLLGRVGMRVIKVESTGRADGARVGDPGFFDWLHAGQESVGLDLAGVGGREALRRLLGRADVVIEGSRPRALRQMGIHAEEVVGARPGVTWVSITGYGRQADAGQRVAFGDDAAVAAGLVAYDDAGRPVFCGDAIADPITGLVAAVAAVASVVAGGGHLVDVPMVGAVRSVLGAPVPGEAERGADGEWWVEGQRVVRPKAPKPPADKARALGADTEAVLREC